MSFMLRLAIGLAVLNVLFTALTIVSRRNVAPETYTWKGDDFPEYWPLPDGPPVAMSVEESVRYTISGPDARDEWANTSPAGFGYIRLGPEHRAFAVSMFHQYHCLRVMRGALAGDYRPNIKGHFEHCENYLRQMILCEPDLTLEPADVLNRDFEVERAGSVHVCRNWKTIYDEIEKNWQGWVKVRDAGGYNYTHQFDFVDTLDIFP